jgi:2,4-dienoyl-CoA reductase-like NADH-dependent reductase (Old Yellow Enzyme family)
MSYRKVAQLRTASDFRHYLEELGVTLPFDETMTYGAGAPLAQTCSVYGKTIGNRLSVLPMEGWDAEADGRPSELVKRRWMRFGQSGAKLIWGGEAAAVRHDGRANPLQLMITRDTAEEVAGLRNLLVEAHRERFGTTDNMLIGLQLTHSGRFCRPNDK